MEAVLTGTDRARIRLQINDARKAAFYRNAVVAPDSRQVRRFADRKAAKAAASAARQEAVRQRRQKR